MQYLHSDLHRTQQLNLSLTLGGMFLIGRAARYDDWSRLSGESELSQVMKCLLTATDIRNSPAGNIAEA